MDGCTTTLTQVPPAGKRKLEPIEDPTVPQTAEARMRSQKMTMRMLASFLHQDGVASDASAAIASDQSQAMKAVADAAGRGPGSEMLNLKIEARLRVEVGASDLYMLGWRVRVKCAAAAALRRCGALQILSLLPTRATR